MQAFIDRNGGEYSGWYVGISADARERLEDHNVKKGYHFNTASTEEVAREVEKHFLDLGCDGGPGGGKNPKQVYVYKITADTDP